MITTGEFFTRISDRYSKLKPGELVCPWCGSAITEAGRYTTLLGYSGAGPDPNHVTSQCRCSACGVDFSRHYKDDNVWFTIGECLLYGVGGVPNCFENYIYNCVCGGLLHRHFVNLSDTNEIEVLSELITKGRCVRSYRIFWKCGKCKQEFETDFDYPRPQQPQRPLTLWQRFVRWLSSWRKRKPFYAYECVGGSVDCTADLEKRDFT